MAKGIHSVHVRQTRGGLRVVALGQTPRGQTYIQLTLPMSAPRMRSKEFKKELAEAMDQLFPRAGTPD